MEKGMKCGLVFVFFTGILLSAGCGGGDVTLNALNPRGVIELPPVRGIQPRVDDLNGKTIGLIDNTKAGARNFLNAVQSLLEQRYPDAKFVAPAMPPGKPLFDKVDWYPEAVKEFDTFILATGD
jgi:hypothetical protein